MAGIHTLFVNAGLSGGTIRVQLADGLRRRTAVHIGIAEEVGRTATHSQVVLRPALRSRSTWVVVHTWIDALFVLAGLVRGAVVVAAAANDAAALVGITAIATQAAALRPVGLDVALGIGTAGIVDQARVDAVAVDAGLARVALSIHPASDRATGGIGIALEAVLAAAHCSVLGHLADGVGAAVARVAALAMDTGLLVRTVVVALTSGRALQYQLAAFTAGIGHLGLGALTDHGSHRNAVQDTALSRAGAWRENCAWVLALDVDARQSAGTISIVSAHWLHWSWFAVGVRISKRQLVWATAHSAMLQGLADGVLGTRILLATWIHALVGHTGQVGGAVVVRVAFQAQAAHEGIALQSDGTAAVGAMVAAIALGIQGTRIRDQARIHALPIQTLLVAAALVIRLATNRRTSELGVAREAWLAVANGVVVLHRALGIGSTVAGTGALGIDAGLARRAVGIGLASHGDNIRGYRRD